MTVHLALLIAWGWCLLSMIVGLITGKWIQYATRSMRQRSSGVVIPFPQQRVS